MSWVADESSLMSTYTGGEGSGDTTIWDGGLTSWDVVGGTPLTYWDGRTGEIGLEWIVAEGSLTSTWE